MTGPASPTTRFGRLERRGVLLGLSGAQVAVVGTATAIVVAAVYSAGTAGLARTSPAWLLLLLTGTVTLGGRSLVAWLPVVGRWFARRLTGTTKSSASTRACAATHQLPVMGLATPLELVACPEVGAVLVHDRRAATVTAAVRVDGSGFVLADELAQHDRTGAWGRVLAGLCQHPSVIRLQVITRNRPGGMSRPRAWWREHSAPGADPVTQALGRMLDEQFVEPRVHESLVAVAVRAPRGHRRLTAADVTAVGQMLGSLAASLVSSGIRTSGWLLEEELLGAVHAGYDPGAAGRFEDVPAATAISGVTEAWGNIATGTAVHATYWVSEWPRSDVHPAFLQPLLLGDGTDRTVTLILEPLPTGKALREIRRAKVEHAADSAQRARIGQIESESTRAERTEIERREAELVAGHGDLRFTGLITVSAASQQELDQRCATMETAAAQAMCEVRRLVGQQGAAHAATCLPLARGVL